MEFLLTTRPDLKEGIMPANVYEAIRDEIMRLLDNEGECLCILL